MSMIYSLVSRGNTTVLASYTSASGNFPSISEDVLKRTNMNKTFGQFAKANYNFYTFIKEGFVFLVMYQMRIAINFLKQLQEVFFTTYDPSRRATAVAHSLKEFNNVLKNKMEDYNDKTKIDKLSKLKDQLSELQQQALRNMDKLIERGEKIEILVKKSQVLSNQSLDVRSTSKRVRDKMWWKNKKIMIGIIVLLLVIAGVVTLIIVLSK